MPCYKCSNGKYKYGERGRCQFDTLSACEAAERAIYAAQNKPKKSTKAEGGCEGCGKGCDCHECRRNRIKQQT